MTCLILYSIFSIILGVEVYVETYRYYNLQKISKVKQEIT